MAQLMSRSNCKEFFMDFSASVAAARIVKIFYRLLGQCRCSYVSKHHRVHFVQQIPGFVASGRSCSARAGIGPCARANSQWCFREATFFLQIMRESTECISCSKFQVSVASGRSSGPRAGAQNLQPVRFHESHEFLLERSGRARAGP